MTTIDAHSSGKRQRLPQTTGTGLFVTDGGLETELVFHDGIDLPSFAAFPLLDNPDTRARLRRYYDGYLDIARKLDAGFIVETPTWRANPDWASTLGYSLEQLDAVNRSAVALAEEIRTAGDGAGLPRWHRPAVLRGLPVAGQPRYPRPIASLLRRLSRYRTRARRGLHRRDTHVARESDWLRASSTRASSSRHPRGARIRIGLRRSGTRSNSSTPSTARRWRSPRRSGRLRRPTESPSW